MRPTAPPRAFRLLLLLIALPLGGGCRKKVAEPAPTPAPHAAPSPAPPAASPPDAEPWPSLEDAAPSAPSPAEIREALTPVLPGVARCIAELGKWPDASLPDGGAAPLELRVAVSPSGRLLRADFEGSDELRRCVGEALATATFPTWKGNFVVATVPLYPGPRTPKEAPDAGSTKR